MMRSKEPLALVAGVLLPFALIVVVIAWHWPSDRDLSPQDGDAFPGGTAVPLRFVIGSMVSPVTTEHLYGGLLRLVGERLGMPVVMLQRRGYAESNAMLDRGEADAGWICTGAYATLARKGDWLVLAAPVQGHQAEYHSVVIVRANAPFQGFEDLRGRSFALVDPLSLSGRAWVLWELRRRDQDPRRFFREVRYSGSHDRSIEWVLEGEVDAAAVDSLIVEHLRRTRPKEMEELRVLLASEAFPSPPIVASGSLPAGLQHRLQDILTTLHQEPEGIEILEGLGIRGFRAVDPEAYRQVSEIMAVAGEEGMP